MARHLKTITASAAIAALLAAGTALAPAPAAAQQRNDYHRYGDRALDRYARNQFERGYRAGREEERRRASRYSGDDDRSSPRSSSGGVADVDRYFVVPDILPDTPRYRGMQDFALIPDYSRSMDRLFAAAQSLREAVQAMAQHFPSDRRDRAMDRAREALLETQQAMVQLPPEQRTR